jgi:hypothetical protein
MSDGLHHVLELVRTTTDILNVLKSNNKLVGTLTADRAEMSAPFLNDTQFSTEAEVNRLIAFVLLIPVTLIPHTIYIATQQPLPFLREYETFFREWDYNAVGSSGRSNGCG